VGGGYPVAAFGASKEMMDIIVNGKMFHGGVFSGNAVVMAAADACLTKVLSEKTAIYRHLDAVTTQLGDGLRDILTRLNVPHIVNHVGSLIGLILTKTDGVEIANYRDLRRHGDFDTYTKFQQYMQQRGVYFHPNMFETWFTSTAHTAEDMALVLERLEEGARACLAR
jgi:glutamate-1-semialdehyde 2,1-aminomutase